MICLFQAFKNKTKIRIACCGINSNFSLQKRRVGRVDRKRIEDEDRDPQPGPLLGWSHPLLQCIVAEPQKVLIASVGGFHWARNASWELPRAPGAKLLGSRGPQSGKLQRDMAWESQTILTLLAGLLQWAGGGAQLQAAIALHHSCQGNRPVPSAAGAARTEAHSQRPDYGGEDIVCSECHVIH